MVVYIQKYDVYPHKRAEWVLWAERALAEIQQTPGLIDVSMHRQRVASKEIAVIYSFATMESWSVWSQCDTVRLMSSEIRSFTEHLEFELWDTFALTPQRLEAIVST